MNKTNSKAYIALILSTVIFGFSFLSIKKALISIENDIFTLLSYRFVIAFIALSLFILLSKNTISFKGKTKKNIMLLCLFSPLLSYIFQSLGISMISSFEAGMFVALIPVFTLILNYIVFKEKITKLKFSFMILSIIGVFIINIFGYQPGNSSLWGRIFMTIMVMCAALYMILARLVSEEYSPIEITWTMMAVGAVAFLAIALTQNIINGTIHTFIGVLKNTQFFWSIMYIAVGCSVIAGLSINYAIPNLKVAIVTIFANIVPVIAIFAGVMFLNESVYWYHILGSIIILVGVLGASLAPNSEG